MKNLLDHEVFEEAWKKVDHEPKVRVWLGDPPAVCNICQTPIEKTFSDMATLTPAGTLGPWAILCPTCVVMGPGCGRYGAGFGQRYEKKNGQFVKVQG